MPKREVVDQAEVTEVLMEALDLEQLCTACNAIGQITNDKWIEWRKARAEGRELPTPFEPETVRCLACRGRGTLPTELGRKILDFVTRHQG